MHQFLRHLFVPHESNNHRPKVLHHSSLIVFILFFVIAGLLLPPIKKSHPDVLGISANITAIDLLSLTNQDRAANNLPPLRLNTDLTNAAQAKAQYMFVNNFWAHFAPDGTSPWYFIKNAGYDYIYAGENLARGFTTSSDVVNAWMASPGHRANMLSSNYNDVGFAIQEGNLTGEDTILVVEMFGSEAQSPLAEDTTSVAATTNVAVSITPVPSLALSPTPVNVAVISGNIVMQQVQPKEVAGIQQQPLINSASTSQNIALIILSILFAALLFDIIYLRRKTVVRFVAHNIDHLLFFGMILILLLFIIGKGMIS